MDEQFSASDASGQELSTPQDQASRLGPCPDCDRLISTRAPVCPNCGCPFDQETSSDEARRFAELTAMAGVCHGLATLVLLLGLLGLPMLFFYLRPSGEVLLATVMVCLWVAPSLLMLWTQGTLLRLLADVEHATRLLRREPGWKRPAAPIRPDQLNSEDRQFVQKLSDVLVGLLQSSKNVNVDVELTTPLPLGSAEAARLQKDCGLHVLDHRASYQVLLKYKVDRLHGSIHTSRLLDLARLPQVRRVSVG